HDRLAAMVEAVQNGNPVRSAKDLIRAVTAYCKAQRADAEPASDIEEAAPTPVLEAEESVPTLDETVEEITGDEDLVSVFLDEARDLMESAEENYTQWHDKPSDTAALTTLTRDLHTLKGGA